MPPVHCPRRSKKPLCMNPGPIEFEHKVLHEMCAPGISHVDPAFIDVFGKSLEQMREVFLAKDGQPLIVAGSGTLGWDMVGANLIRKGDKALVVNTGYFGDNFGECLQVYGAEVVHVRAPVGSRPSSSDVAAALQGGNKYKLVTITHVDTSTGVLNDIKELSKAIRAVDQNILIVVDSVCALGGEELRMQEWDLDVVLTGSQKCIGVPAGLSLVMVRPRAVKIAENYKTIPPAYYVNWQNWFPIMKNYEARKPSYFATPAVNHIYALHAAFDILLSNGGMEARFKEQKLVSVAIKQAIAALGLKEVPQNGCAANTMTCVRFPTGVTGPDLLPKVVANGVSLAGGLHKEIKTEYFRIGHMGQSSRRIDHAMKTIEALESALDACGYSFTRGAGTKEIASFAGQFPSTSCCKAICTAPTSCHLMTLSIVAVSLSIGMLIGAKISKS